MIKIKTKKFKTHKIFCEEVINLVGEEYTVLSTYINAKEKILFRHNYDRCNNYEFAMSPSNFLTGRRCPKCAGSLHKTHEEFLEDIKNINLNIKILGQYITAKDTIKVKCLKCNGEWEPIASSLLQGSGCPYCANQKILIGLNDMWTTNYNLAKLLFNIEDGYKYTQKSKKRLDWKCPNCGVIIKNKTISDICNNGLSCPKCSDGKSYPEKFMFSILEQLGVDFISQLNKSYFNWCGSYKYDFYLPNINCIIEIHGIQHYEQTSRKYARNLQDEQENDKIKENLAKENGIINYIVLDCRYSTLEWIKNGILNSKLGEIFNLLLIDWIKCEEYAMSSLVLKVCNIWNSGIKNTKDISNITKISQGVVIIYLKQGDKLNLCNYNPKKSYKYKYLNGYKSNIRKQVICIETSKIYDSIVEAGIDMNCPNTHISSCCKNKRKTCGKLEDGTPLHWKYVVKEVNVLCE